MIKAGIIGVTGYTGAELLRLLYSHQHVEIAKVASRSNQGNQVSDHHYHLLKAIDLVEEDLSDLAGFVQGLDVVFLALPHGTASEVVAQIGGKVKIIDLSADFRLKSLDTYTKWYGVEHSCPEFLAHSVYGLPELYRDAIKDAEIVANPGCYPTSIILGLYPLLQEGLVSPSSVLIADSKSGVSGAGKKTADHTHFPEINENFYAYNPGKHRHTPEIQQELRAAGSLESLPVVFSPHLVPMSRGILSTIYTELTSDLSLEEIYRIYDASYQDESFVRVRKDRLPQTKFVSGSNYCDIGIVKNEETNTLIVVSAIDNLMRGASGQAVMNMNIMFGLPEKTGIDFLPVYP